MMCKPAIVWIVLLFLLFKVHIVSGTSIGTDEASYDADLFIQGCCVEVDSFSLI